MTHYVADLVAPLDALLLKGDADPSTRAIMNAALVLSSEPDNNVLGEAFERAARAVPRMRQRVVDDGLNWGRATWVPDDAFDVMGHVRHVGAPGDSSISAVLAMASSFATAPFDAAKPLWDATLVTGVEGGRAVLLMRVHHAIADGVRVLHMMANLLDLEPHPSRDELPALEQRGAGIRAVGERWMRTTSQVMVTRRQRADSFARLMLEGSLHPRESISGAARYSRSILRTYAGRGVDPSPILRSRSRGRRFAVLEFPLAEIREVGKAHSATVNDVFMTGLLGGLRTYQERMGGPVVDLPIAFPINVAVDTSHDSGNHFSAGVIPGPCSVQDPVERLQAVHGFVAARRAEPGVDAPLRLAPLLHQVPSRFATSALKAYARRVDLQASNIIGPDFAVFLAGAQVERFYAFGPLPGIPLMAVLVSYEGTCTVGFTIDPAAVADVELLLACTLEAFSELGVNAVGPASQE